MASIVQYLNISAGKFARMTEQELRKATKALGYEANRRYTRLQKAGLESPAKTIFEKSGGRVTIKGKTVSELRTEYIRAKNLLEAETGSVRGVRKWKRNAIKGMRARGIDISPDKFDEFWHIYEDMRERYPAVGERGFKYALLDKISEAMDDDVDMTDKIEMIANSMSDIYEGFINESDFDGVSGFF